MKSKHFVIIAASILLLSGCARIPEKVKENMGKYNTHTTVDSINTVKYDSIENIIANADLALQKKYQNLILPKHITIDGIQDITYPEFEVINGFDNDYLSVFHTFFSKNIIDNQNFISKKSGGSNLKGFQNEQKKVYGNMSDGGWVAILQPQAYQICFQDDYLREKMIHVDRGEAVNVVYPLLGGETSVQEQISYVEGWLKDKWGKYEPPGFTFHVKTVIVRKLSDKQYYYQMRIEKYYKGIPLDELGEVIAIDKNNTHYLKNVVSYIDIQVMKKDTISSFNCPMILSVSKEHHEQKYIDLQSALKLAEKELSGFQDLEISDIEIKYTLEPKYDYKSQDASYDRPGTKMITRPVWAFIMDVPKDEYTEKNGTILFGNLRRYILVDMLTGKVRYEKNYYRTY